MKVLFAGGGTAGHINPALAIAGYLREREPDVEILYIGAKGGMEERLVPAAGYPFKSITISGFQRKLSWENLKKNAKTVVRMFTSSQEARKILEAFRPDVCVGTGGYVSGPVIRDAIKMGIPSVIHEQNAYPGVTNKALSRHATRTMLAVADAQRHLDPKARCVLTGNPVRQEVIRARRADARKKLGLDERPLILSCRSFGLERLFGQVPAHSRLRPMGEMVPRSPQRKRSGCCRAPQYGHPRVHQRYAGLPGSRRSCDLPCRCDYAQ